MYGVKSKAFSEKKEPLYNFSGLGQFRRRRAGNLSGGMKQKLALSCALVHDPEVLILDEPTTGVDPLSRRQFWNILKSLRDDGATIVVSTPYMDEAGLSDKVVFMHEGHKLAEGKPEDLTALYVGSVYEVMADFTTDLLSKAKEMKGLDARRFGASMHVYADKETPAVDIELQLESVGFTVDFIRRIEPDLEDTFIQLMGMK
jgi:ABC-2 type transport system ATP-binding protein